MHWLADHAATAVASVVVAVLSTVNIVVGWVALMFAAEVNDGLLTGIALFVLGTGTGIVGWALVLLVRLSNVVSRLEATAEDHDRRLSRLEP